MQVPWLDKILYKNQYVDRLRQTPGNSLLKFVADTIGERQETFDQKSKEQEMENHRKDFLDRYIGIQRSNSEIPPWYVFFLVCLVGIVTETEAIIQGRAFLDIF